VLPSNDPASTVNRANIPETCGACHLGVAEVYAESVHGRVRTEHNGDAAVCTDCHTAHEITLASSRSFVLDVIEECGECHDRTSEEDGRAASYYQTYHLSYHGQVSRLGGKRAARCSDCHGSHDIRPLDDPTSRVSAANLVPTCAQCHPGATASFARFDPHADYRDAKNYPILHGVWLYFVILMSTVFGLFGIHTVLWFVRSKIDRRRSGTPPAHTYSKTAIRRFSKLNRVNHLLVMVTFFGLTATGIPLVFNEQGWAAVMARGLGGIEAAGLWHRFFAVMLICNFIVHFVGLGISFARRQYSWKQWVFGPNSLLPRWKDAKDIFGMCRWFFGLGPRPRFDRWTYWEKFDYWAEVAGSIIIGGSGLLLWFPELAARIVPGWAFNVAMIVHGYEALLAIGFIFTIHFFNAHLRPGVFPADEVIFTGSLPEEELKEQRPVEYERLVRTGQLESLRVEAPDPAHHPRIIGMALALVSIGLILILLIIIGGLT
jgi:cytochrome b subunit of formate dehydrogenase